MTIILKSNLFLAQMVTGLVSLEIRNGFLIQTMFRRIHKRIQNRKRLRKPYGIDGITFKNFEPDFTPIAKESFKIKNFSEKRNKNFKQGDLQLAIKMGVSPEEAKAYRKEHRLTYHERSDMKTLDLVPIDAHGAIPHKGGIAKCKELNEKKGNES